MIKWVQKRQIDGNSADSNLDDGAAHLQESLDAFNEAQEPVSRAVDYLFMETIENEKMRHLIQEVIDAAANNRDKYLENIEAALKSFDLAVMRLKKEE